MSDKIYVIIQVKSLQSQVYLVTSYCKCPTTLVTKISCIVLLFHVSLKVFLGSEIHVTFWTRCCVFHWLMIVRANLRNKQEITVRTLHFAFIPTKIRLQIFYQFVQFIFMNIPNMVLQKIFLLKYLIAQSTFNVY